MTQFRLYALNALSRSAMAVSAPLRQLVLLPQAGQDQMLRRILCASDEPLQSLTLTSGFFQLVLKVLLDAVVLDHTPQQRPESSRVQPSTAISIALRFHSRFARLEDH